MFTTSPLVDLSGFLTEASVVDNLVSAVPDLPLSANQGKILKDLLDAKVAITSINLVGSEIVLTTDAGTELKMDASSLIIDKNAISGTYDEATQSIVINLNDSTSFSIPVASLLPIVTDATLSGNGSGVPLSISLSSDTGNQLLLGTDGKILVKYPEVSNNPNNVLSYGTDDRLFLEVDNDFSGTNNNAVASQGATKSYIDTEVDKVVKPRVFMDDTTLAPATAGNPTLAEVRVFADNLTPQYRDGIMYYTGNDDSTSAVEQVYHIDRVGNVTFLFDANIASPTTIVQNMSTPKVDEVLSTQGIKDIMPLPNNLYIFEYTVGRPINTGNAVNLCHTPWYTIQKNKNIKLSISVPVRCDSSTWGGMYLNPNIRVRIAGTSTWYNLGNGGYDGNTMFSSASSITTYRDELHIDRSLINVPDDTEYEVMVELYVRPYNYRITINSSHDINRTSNNLGLRGSVLQLKQRYTHIKVEEY